MRINFEYRGDDLEYLVFEMEGFPYDVTNSALVVTGVETHVDDFFVPWVVKRFVLHRGKHSQVAKLIGMIRDNDGIKSNEEYLEFVQRVKEEEKIKIDGLYQLLDHKDNLIGDTSKEPIQNSIPGLKIRFTSVQFVGDSYESNIPQTRIWGNRDTGAEATVFTSCDKQTNLCLHSFVVIGRDPQAVENQIKMVKRRLGVGEKPEGLIL